MGEAPVDLMEFVQQSDENWNVKNMRQDIPPGFVIDELLVDAKRRAENNDSQQHWLKANSFEG